MCRIAHNFTIKKVTLKAICKYSLQHSLAPVAGSHRPCKSFLSQWCSLGFIDEILVWGLQGKFQVINCILHIENNAEWSFLISFFFKEVGGKSTKPVVKGPKGCAPRCAQPCSAPPQPEKRTVRQEGGQVRMHVLTGVYGKSL